MNEFQSSHSKVTVTVPDPETLWMAGQEIKYKSNVKGKKKSNWKYYFLGETQAKYFTETCL